jgi:hypothetical protein
MLKKIATYICILLVGGVGFFCDIEVNSKLLKNEILYSLKLNEVSAVELSGTPADAANSLT